MGTASTPHSYQRGLETLHAMKTAKSDFFSKKYCLDIGSFHETAKVVNSLQVSTAGMMRCRQSSPAFP